jgi:hypothetical protein
MFLRIPQRMSVVASARNETGAAFEVTCDDAGALVACVIDFEDGF